MEIPSLYHLFLQHPTITTDSRNCPKGSIFFALRGDNFNGNTFAKKALEAGSAYAVIDDKDYMDDTDGRMILVGNALQTLQKLANYHRKQLGTRIIGITGTNGKTTTKELMATVLSQAHKILYTEGNLNNAIGVPLTLLRLNPEHDLAVIEMGASHPGDIKELTEIAEPDFGIITNVGMAHLQGFGSFDGVLSTKCELFNYLSSKPESIVFVNNDNPYLTNAAQNLHQIRYGIPNEEAALNVSGEVIESSPFLHFRWRMGKSVWNEVQTHLIGKYNIDNMLAAITVGLYFGIPPTQINKALSTYIPQNSRSQLKETLRNKLIVDAYNANPTSMMAALKNFHDMPVSPKMVILGDMKELGEYSLEEHKKIVKWLEDNDFQHVWLVGETFTSANTRFKTFTRVEQINEILSVNPPCGFYILIKGSNSMQLIRTIDFL